jgi:ABC-type dipeptide/oligopeptide/nickel transport system permease component
MRKYLARRAVFALVTLLGVSLSIFVILRVLPGEGDTSARAER